MGAHVHFLMIYSHIKATKMISKATCFPKMVMNLCVRHCSQITRFNGKIAVITGSTQGIGLATARRFAQEGAKVIICSRKQQNVDDALKTLNNEGLDVTGLVCHVAKEDERRNLIYEAEKFGGIDILVQNAGANPKPGPIIDCSESMWNKIMDTNLKASFFLAKESLPLIRKRGGGSIIFMSTIGAYVPRKKVGAAYSVSKTGLLMLTKAMAGEFAEYNIRVNSVAPGLIETNFAQILLEDSEKKYEEILLNRGGKPESVAGVITFLASQDAEYITGENIVIAGGMTSRL